jgi:regulator of sigma E protease
MDVGRITSVVHNSPAGLAGIEVGDKILRVNDKEVGTTIDPLKLPDFLGQLKGQEVSILIQRPVKGADGKEMEIRLVPTDKPGWVERPLGEDHPLSVPAIGVAFPVIPTVLKVDPGSPAEEAGILKGERIRKAQLVLPENQPADIFGEDPIKVEFDGKEEVAGRPVNWAYVFWMMQKAPSRNVVLTVSGSGEPRVVTLEPRPNTQDDWFVPDERGLQLMLMATTQKADGIADAFSLGLAHTENSITDIYLSLRNLLGRELSYKELHGPLGIAKVAYMVAEQGVPELLLFLGFLSVNLAVLNFLPIPVLDGGHMVFLIWEGITRKRPSERVLVAATYCGMAFVLCLMMLVLYLDIFEHKIVGN